MFRRRYSQVVRQWIANPPSPSSNLGAAFFYLCSLDVASQTLFERMKTGVNILQKIKFVVFAFS